jgi:hypothetical protein
MDAGLVDFDRAQVPLSCETPVFSATACPRDDAQWLAQPRCGGRIQLCNMHEWTQSTPAH